MCRSGNHCIIFWMIDNMGGIRDRREGTVYWNSDNHLYYYNNCSRFQYNYITNYNTLIKSYEDMYNKKPLEDNTTKIIILRDFLNMASSRYRKYNPNFGLDWTYFESIDQIIHHWKLLANEIINNDNIVGILYNKWLSDKKYRDNISEKLNILNHIDNTDIIPVIGEGSSFKGVQLEDDKNKYNERYLLVKLPEYVIDKILEDDELLELNKILFGIDIRDLLSK